MYNHLFPGVSTDLSWQLFKLKEKLKKFLDFYFLINKNQMAPTCDTISIVHSEMNPLIQAPAAVHGVLWISNCWGGAFKRHSLSGSVWLWPCLCSGPRGSIKRQVWTLGQSSGSSLSNTSQAFLWQANNTQKILKI